MVSTNRFCDEQIRRIQPVEIPREYLALAERRFGHLDVIRKQMTRHDRVPTALQERGQRAGPRQTTPIPAHRARQIYVHMSLVGRRNRATYRPAHQLTQ
jgi:hypothetical protein